MVVDYNTTSMIFLISIYTVRSSVVEIITIKIFDHECEIFKTVWELNSLFVKQNICKFLMKISKISNSAVLCVYYYDSNLYYTNRETQTIKNIVKRFLLYSRRNIQIHELFIRK